MTDDVEQPTKKSRIPTIIGIVLGAITAIAAVLALIFQYQKEAQSLVVVEVTGERQSITYPPVVDAEWEKVGRLVSKSWPPPIKGLESGECKIEGYGKHDRIEKVSCPADPLRAWFEDSERRFRRPEWFGFRDQGTVTIKNVGTKHLVKGSKLKLPALAGEYVLQTGVDPARRFDREIELPALDAGDFLTVRWWAGSSDTDSSTHGQVPRVSLPDGGNVYVFPVEKPENFWGLWIFLLVLLSCAGLIASHGYAFNKGISVQFEYSRSQAATRKKEAAKAPTDVSPAPNSAPTSAGSGPSSTESPEPPK